MKISRLTFAFSLLLSASLVAKEPATGTATSDAASPLYSMINAAKQVPKMRWEDQSGPVHQLIYEGESYQGHPTEVFAFYASPSTLGENSSSANPTSETKYPAVVLIHGGGGTAFAEWAWLWAKRGYAAIAMDLAGSRPIDPIYDPKTGVPIRNQTARRETRTRLPLGGPDQGHDTKFDSIDDNVSDDWPYHAASNVLRAHSLIRSFDEVNAEQTAVTGISWGGYTTCLAASLDDRFNAAVPVYGCGFLFEGESVQKPSIDQLNDRREAWIKAYDPSSVLTQCRVPILFVNGTNDIHYPLDSYQKSFDAVPGEKQIRIEVNMPHGHPSGWAPQEIGIFIDSHCRGGVPLATLEVPVIDDNKIHVAYQSQAPLKSATLHYTTDTGIRSKRKWKSTPAKVTDETITAAKPPQDANTWFVSVTDQRDAMVTTPVQFQDPTPAP